MQLRLQSGQFAYLQYVCAGWHAPVIRVLPGLFDTAIEQRALRTLVAGPSLFRTQFHLDPSIGRREGRVVARLPIPPADAGMPPFRLSAGSPHRPDLINVVDADGTDLSGTEFLQRHPGADLAMVPLWWIPFYGTLSWMIQEQWIPAMADGLTLGLPDDEPKPVPSRIRSAYVCSFATLEAVEAGAEAVRELGFRNVKIHQPDGASVWFVDADRPRAVGDAGWERRLQALAAEHGGAYERARLASPGDVIQLQLQDGRLAYVQYACPGWAAPVARACAGLFDAPLDGDALRRLVEAPSLFRSQCYLDLLLGEQHGTVVAHLPVPDAEAALPPFRLFAYSPKRTEITEPDGEQINGVEFLHRHPGTDLDTVPVWAITFYHTLSQMLEEQWTPRRANGISLNLPIRVRPTEREDPSLPADRASTAAEQPKQRRIHTSYICYFDEHDNAERAAAAVRAMGLRNVEVGQDDGTDEWLVSVQRSGRPDGDLEHQLQQVATAHHGTYHGNIVGPLT